MNCERLASLSRLTIAPSIVRVVQTQVGQAGVLRSTLQPGCDRNQGSLLVVAHAGRYAMLLADAELQSSTDLNIPERAASTRKLFNTHMEQLSRQYRYADVLLLLLLLLLLFSYLPQRERAYLVHGQLQGVLPPEVAFVMDSR